MTSLMQVSTQLANTEWRRQEVHAHLICLVRGASTFAHCLPLPLLLQTERDINLVNVD